MPEPTEETGDDVRKREFPTGPMQQHQERPHCPVCGRLYAIDLVDRCPVAGCPHPEPPGRPDDTVH